MVPIVERNLAVVIISAVRFVIQAAAENANFYQARLRHAVVEKQGWQRNVKVVWTQYLPALNYVASSFIVGYILVRRHAMLGNVHHVWF